MGKVKRFLQGIWQILTVVVGIVLFFTWDVWRRRRYKEKVDDIQRATDATINSIKDNVELGDGAALFNRAKDRIDS